MLFKASPGGGCIAIHFSEFLRNFSDRHEGFSLLTEPDSSEGLGPQESNRCAASVFGWLDQISRTSASGSNLPTVGPPIPTFRLGNVYTHKAPVDWRTTAVLFRHRSVGGVSTGRGEREHSSQRQTQHPAMNVLPRRPPAESTFLKVQHHVIRRVNGRSAFSILGRSMRGSFTRLSARRLDDLPPPPWLSSPSLTIVRSRWVITGDKSGVFVLLREQGACFNLELLTRDSRLRR